MFKHIRCLSGGADGADSLFGSIFSNTIVYSFRGHKAYMHKGNIKHICDVDQPQITDIYRKISVMRGREMSKNDYIANLIKRDFWQCNDLDGTLTQAVIAIATLESGSQVEGGTGYAVEWAKINKVALIFVLDYKNMQWYKFNYASKVFDKVTAPDLSGITLFTGIGSRSVKGAYEDICRKEIEKVFTKNVAGDEIEEENNMEFNNTTFGFEDMNLDVLSNLNDIEEVVEAEVEEIIEEEEIDMKEIKEEIVLRDALEALRVVDLKKYAKVNGWKLKSKLKGAIIDEIVSYQLDVKEIEEVQEVKSEFSQQYAEFIAEFQAARKTRYDKFISSTHEVLILPCKSVYTDNDIHVYLGGDCEIILKNGKVLTPANPEFFKHKYSGEGINKGMMVDGRIVPVGYKGPSYEEIKAALPERYKNLPVFLGNFGSRSNIHKSGDFVHIEVNGEHFVLHKRSGWFDTAHPSHVDYSTRELLSASCVNLAAMIFGMKVESLVEKFIDTEGVSELLNNFYIEDDLPDNTEEMTLIAEYSMRDLPIPDEFMPNHINTGDIRVYFGNQPNSIKQQIIKYFAEWLNSNLPSRSELFDIRVDKLRELKLDNARNIFQDYQKGTKAFYGTIKTTSSLGFREVALPERFKADFIKRKLKVQTDDRGLEYVEVDMLTKREPTLSQFGHIRRVYFHTFGDDSIYVYAPQFCNPGLGADFDGDTIFLFFASELEKIAGAKIDWNSPVFKANEEVTEKAKSAGLYTKPLSFEELKDKWHGAKMLSESFSKKLFKAVVGFEGESESISNIQTWILQKDAAGLCGGFLNTALIGCDDHNLFRFGNIIQEFGIKCKRGVTNEHGEYINLIKFLIQDASLAKKVFNAL